jgi:hypothetical protein
MNEYSVKSGMPSVSEALIRLQTFIKMTQKKERIIKIVHGYGSSGVGGSIKEAVRAYLAEQKNKGLIKSYIPGEAFSQMMGFDAEIKTYQSLLEKDSDYRKSNSGITYIIF